VTPSRIPVEVRRPGLLVLVGAAGSGKTTLATRLFAPDEVISSDELRAVVSGDPADQRATRTAFGILHREVGRWLTQGRLVVVDATNVEPAARRSLLQRAAAAHASATAVVLALPDELVHARNAGRPGRPVPRDVVERHLARMTDLVGAGVLSAIATLSAEGFARVVVVRTDDEVARLEIVRGPAVSPR